MLNDLEKVAVLPLYTYKLIYANVSPVHREALCLFNADEFNSEAEIIKKKAIKRLSKIIFRPEDLRHPLGSIRRLADTFIVNIVNNIMIENVRLSSDLDDYDRDKEICYHWFRDNIGVVYPFQGGKDIIPEETPYTITSRTHMPAMYGIYPDVNSLRE